MTKIAKIAKKKIYHRDTETRRRFRRTRAPPCLRVSVVQLIFSFAIFVSLRSSRLLYLRELTGGSLDQAERRARPRAGEPRGCPAERRRRARGRGRAGVAAGV